MRTGNGGTRLGVIVGVLWALGLWCLQAWGAQDAPLPLQTYGLGDLQRILVAPDGRFLATAGQSGAVLWNLEPGTVRHQFTTHGGKVTALAFSPDGRLLLTAGADRQIRVWDTDSGAELRAFPGNQGEIQALSFDASGQRFAAASADNTARVWSLETGEIQAVVEVPGVFMQAVEFTPDGEHLVTADGSQTNNVRIWNLATQTTIHTLGEHVGTVKAMGFIAGGLLATAGDDGTVRLWDVDTGAGVRTLQSAGQYLSSLVVSREGTRVVVAGAEGRITSWNALTGEIERSWVGPNLHGLSAAAESDRVFAAQTDNVVREWDVETGVEVRQIVGHTTSVTLGVAFSPDGQSIASGGTEAPIRLWNRDSGEQVRMMEGHGGGTATVAFTPDGERILSTRGAPKPSAQLWNATTGELERSFEWTTGWPMCAALSKDGTRLATGGQDARVRVWDVASGNVVRTLTGPAAWVMSVAFSPDGTRLASGGSSFAPIVSLWDLTTGQSLHTFELNAGSVKSLCFNSTGQELLVGWEDGFLHAYDVASGKLRREYDIPTGFMNAAIFSPDDSLILIGEGWPTFVARLVDTASGETVRFLPGHSWSVESVAFNANGTRVLTGSDRVRLWAIDDLATRLTIRRAAGGLEVAWNVGVLQQAVDVAGPWTDLPEATSPWAVPQTAATGFHRVRVGTPTE